MPDLKSAQIAFLAKRGVEEPELTEPWEAVLAAGGVPVLISDAPGHHHCVAWRLGAGR